MKAVWKFKITKLANQTVAMPAAAKILTVQWQGDGFAIWALVEPNRALEDRRILIVGTGTNLHDKMSLAYIGTVQEPSGDVAHIFEKLS